MTQQEFDAILNRYLAGTATPEEHRLVEKFYDHLQAHPAPPGTWTAEEKEKLRQEMLATLSQQYRVPKPPRNLRRAYAWRIAASVVLFLCAGGLLTYGWFHTRTTSALQYITQRTHEGERATLVLPDGSKVKLNASSSLTYPASFPIHTRPVTLTGEAFFEVQRNPDKPFIVTAAQVTTTVLGTSFNIQAFPQEDVVVTVATGQVSVAPETVGPAILAPSQQAVFHPHERTLQIATVDLATYLAWKENTLAFKGVPFIQVIHTLERWYGIDITLTNTEANHCLVWASYHDEGLHNVLAGLQLLVPFTYQQDPQGNLLITGKGCNH